MPIKYIIFIFIGILIISCENNVKEFRNSASLSGNPVKEIEVLSSGNVYIDVVDTFLVVVKNDEPFINIYSTINHKKLLSFGMEGRGPLDFLGPSLIKSNLNNHENSRSFFVHDYKRNKVAQINIDSVLSDRKKYEIRPIPKSDEYLTYVHYLSERYLIGTPSQRGILSIIDLSSNKSTLIPFLPTLDYSVPTQSLSTIFRPAVLVDEQSSKIAVAPLYLGELNFFDFDGELTKNVLFQSRELYKRELSKGESSFSEIKQQITELESSNGLIYALNSNTAVKNFRKSKRSPKIQVFDWEGKPIKEFLLDNRHIFSIAMDSINNRIYGYDMNAEKNNIVIYDL